MTQFKLMSTRQPFLPSQIQQGGQCEQQRATVSFHFAGWGCPGRTAGAAGPRPGPVGPGPLPAAAGPAPPAAPSPPAAPGQEEVKQGGGPPGKETHDELPYPSHSQARVQPASAGSGVDF